MKTSLDKINLIEKEIKIEEFNYKGINIWPLYRFYIHNKIEKRITKDLNKFSYNFSKILLAISSFVGIFKVLFLISKNSKSKIVFLSNTSFKRFKKNGKWVDPYVHPIAEYLLSSNKSFKILELDLLNEKKDLSYIDSINIQKFVNFFYAVFAMIFMIQTWIVILFYRNHSFSDQVRIAIKNNNLGIEIPDDKFFIKQLSNLRAKALIYKFILKKLNTKFGIITGYGSQDGLSFCLACSLLNIKSIELQHGVISEEMPRYGKWVEVPVSGYQMLPNLFWCWSRSDYDFISKWANKTYFHDVIMGGNLFLSRYKDFLDDESKKIIKEFKEKTRAYDKVVLVALQDKKWEPSWLLKTLTHMSPKIFWAFRFHPADHNKDKRKKDIYKAFHQKGLKNFDVELLNNPSMNIQASIYVSHAVVSSFSSSLLESTILGKESAVISDEGITHYRDYINKNLIKIATTQNSFTSFIDNIDLKNKSLAQPKQNHMENIFEMMEKIFK